MNHWHLLSFHHNGFQFFNPPIQNNAILAKMINTHFSESHSLESNLSFTLLSDQKNKTIKNHSIFASCFFRIMGCNKLVSKELSSYRCIRALIILSHLDKQEPHYFEISVTSHWLKGVQSNVRFILIKFFLRNW